MEKYLPWIGSGLSLLFGIVLGVIFHAWRQHRINLSKRRIPRQWPIGSRSIVNSRERRAWRWITRVFSDHQVLVKMPVTRFTLPLSKDNSDHWFELLSGVYCTFTVCTAEGHVVGCVDVLGPKGLSLSNQTLKHSLLTQCSIRYWVVDHHHLPTETDIRTAFLGADAMITPERRQSIQPKGTTTNTQVIRRSGFSPLESPPPDMEPEIPIDDLLSFHRPLGSGWHENSFMVPMDSRKARLH